MNPQTKLAKALSTSGFNERRHGVYFETPSLIYLPADLSDDKPAGPANNSEPGEVTENAESIVFVVDLDEDLSVRFRTCTTDDLISYGDKPDLIVPEFDDNSELELQYNYEEELVPGRRSCLPVALEVERLVTR
jgi:hypothetical protein